MKGQNLLPICVQVGILAKLALEKPIELAEALVCGTQYQFSLGFLTSNPDPKGF